MCAAEYQFGQQHCHQQVDLFVDQNTVSQNFDWFYNSYFILLEESSATDRSISGFAALLEQDSLPYYWPKSY